MFNEEGSAMYRIGKIMQGKYHTISECSFYNALKPDIKLDIVEHIKECSIEQQQILYYGNRKNHKLLDASIKRKKDTVTESSLVILEMKKSSQQPETKKIELTKFKSNTNEGSSLSINEALQLGTSFTQDLYQLDKDNVNIIYIYIDCLVERESTSAIQCLDHEIGKDKESPPKL